MQVQVLGTLEVTHDGQRVEIAGPLPRRLLALLAARAALDVSTSALVDGLWGDSPPAATSATLQSHMARLRRALPSRDLVRTGPGGYRLAIDRTQVDAGSFADWVSAGVAALRRDEFEEAALLLQRGLTTWRGPAYAEFADCESLLQEGRRLDELRLTAVQCRIEADLGRGVSAGLVAELELLTTEHPSREALWGLLMLAMYRDGRQADALATYQRARGYLLDDLGVEPGEALRHLERLVLTQDQALEPVPVGAKTTIASPPSERRLVSVLVVEDRAIDTDPEDAESRGQVLQDLVARCVEARGGMLCGVAGGQLMAVFGGATARDQDPFQAAVTGLDILSASTAIGIGVATGVAIVAADPDTAPIGGVTASARELAGVAAPCGVVIDDRTRDVCGSVLLTEQVPSGWQVTGLAPAGTTANEPDLVGRDQELSVLLASLASVRTRSSPSWVSVLAEPGVGKTRLLNELCRVVKTASTGVVRRIGCEAHGQNGLELLSALWGDAERATSREALFARWSHALSATANGQPVLLVVEDVHWADDVLFDFLEHLLVSARDTAVLVVTTARPEVLVARPALGVVSPTTHVLHLSRLADDQISLLVEHLSRRSGTTVTIDDGLRDKVIRGAAGVPLYARELVRAVQSDLALVGPAPPATLHAVISARIDSLAPEHRAVLQDAAVVGATFWPGAVIAAGDRTPERVASALAELVRREFVSAVPLEGRAGAECFTFTHELVREVAYDRLLRPDRARRHFAVLRWWEASTSKPEDDAAMLAHQALAAYDLATTAALPELADQVQPLAALYARVAGERALGWDTASAMRLLERAVTLASAEEAARVQLLYGTALFDARRFEEAAAVLEAVLATSGSTPESLRVDAGMYLLNALFGLGRDLAPAIDAMTAITTDFPPGPEVVQALGVIGMSLVMEQTPSSMRAARETVEPAIAMAADLGIARSAWVAHGVRGRARVALGDVAGLEEIAYAIELADTRAANHSIAVGLRLWQAGALHHVRGALAELEARYDVDEFASTRGLSYLISYSEAEKLRVLAELGRLRELVELADRFDVGTDAQPRWVVVQRALALADLGELDGPSLDKVRDTPPADQGDLRHVLGSAIVLATAALEAGNQSAAIANLSQLGGLRRFAERDGAVELLPRLIRTARRAQAPHLTAGLQGVELGGTPLAEALNATLRGLLALAAGEDAVADLELAASRWSGIDARFDEAQTRLDLGEALIAARKSLAAEVLCSVRSELEAMELRPSLSRCDDLLARLGG